MTGNEHERWSEDVAAYMLGALEPEEVAEFERHAEDCERCRSEMRWLTTAVEVLPEAVERLRAAAGAAPAAAGRGRRRRRAAGTRRAGRARAACAAPAPGSSGRGSGSVGWRAARLARARWCWSSSPSAATRSAASGGGGEGGGSTSTFISGHPPGVTAEVVREGEAGELHLAAVRDLPPDRVLEAWVRRDGEVEPVKALFVPDGEGNATTDLGDMQRGRPGDGHDRAGRRQPVADLGADRRSPRQLGGCKPWTLYR